jgi:drug/metabolite transporter (DMT)-like permease
MAFTSAICFSLLPILAVYAYKSGINTNTLLLFRFIIAAVFFFVYIAVKYKKPSLDRKTLLKLFLLGSILYTLQATCFFTAVKYITASFTSLLLYLYPIFVAVLSSVVDRERLSRSILLSIGISFAGLILILGTSIGKIDLRGVFFGIGTAVIYSIYIVFGNRVVKEVSPVITTGFTCFFAALSFFIFGIFSGNISFNFKPSGYVSIIAIAIFPTIISLLTFFKSLELIGSTKSSILSMIEPVSTIILSALLLGDRLSILQIIGAIAVLSGAYLVVASQKSSKNTLKTHELNEG